MRQTIKQLKREISRLRKENRKWISLNADVILNNKHKINKIQLALDKLESTSYDSPKIRIFIYQTREFLYKNA